MIKASDPEVNNLIKSVNIGQKRRRQLVVVANKAMVDAHNQRNHLKMAAPSRG